MSFVYNKASSLIHSKSNSLSFKNLQIPYTGPIRNAAVPQWEHL